jgi:hypothetical protein
MRRSIPQITSAPVTAAPTWAPVADGRLGPDDPDLVQLAKDFEVEVAARPLAHLEDERARVTL